MTLKLVQAWWVDGIMYNPLLGKWKNSLDNFTCLNRRSIWELLSNAIYILIKGNGYSIGMHWSIPYPIKVHFIVF